MIHHPGQRLGNYQLTRLLGRGGFAEVYLGEHVFLRTQAAIKVLQVRLAGEEMQAFLQEARTIASVSHPNILRILEFGVENDAPFLVMEYAPNGTLRQRHPRGTTVPLPLVLSYVRQISSALQYVHNRKMIHRDIKPENLLLGPRLEVLLSDFGTALVVETMQSMGTLEMAGTVTYMAPEQIRGKPRPVSDQYALAIVVYEWLCGVPPFRGTIAELYNLHLYAVPPALRSHVPTLSPEVEEVVMMALAKSPEQRFASIAAFANALEQASNIRAALLRGFTHPPEVNSSTGPTIASDELPTITASPTPVTVEPAVTPRSHPVVSDATAPASPTPSRTPIRSGQHVPLQPASVPASEMPASAFIPVPVPMPAPAPTQTPSPRVSRRALIFGLGLLGLTAAGGLASWLVLQGHRSASASGSPTVSPLLIPGTTYVVYRSHTNQVYTVAWSPGGQHIASGGKDNKVYVWDPTSLSGKNLNMFLKHSGSVNSLAWAPDGSRIASGSSDMQVLVWDALHGEQFLAYRGHTNNIRSVAWSPDGQYLASAGDDMTVQVWNAQTAAPIFTYKNHTAMVWTISWSPDSRRIVSASADGTAQVWDALTGQNITIYRGHRRASAIKSVAWSPDGQLIASGGDIPDSTVQVWSPATLQRVLTYSEHTDGVYALAWSSDAKFIASASWGEARVWKVVSPGGKTLTTYTDQPDAVHTLSWLPHGRRIASGADDTTVRVWQAM